MRESLPQSRRAHYLALAGLLIGFTLLGVVTLRCARGSVPGGSMIPKEGVRSSSESGIEFDKDVGYVEYELDSTFNRPNDDETVASCDWKAVKSLDPLGRAKSIWDFETADDTVRMGPFNRATIWVTKDKPRRSAYFVCEYIVLGKSYFKSHVVRVKNNF